MLPVEILPVQETVVLRARGSELLILPHHVKHLKTCEKPQDFSAYFRTEALVNRPARKLFEAWLRKDDSLWKRLYICIHKEMELKADGGDDDEAPAKKSPKVEAKSAKPDVKKEPKAEAKPAKAKEEEKPAKKEAKAAKPEVKEEPKAKAKAKEEAPAKKAKAEAEDKPVKKAKAEDKPEKKAAKKVTKAKAEDKPAAKKKTKSASEGSAKKKKG